VSGDLVAGGELDLDVTKLPAAKEVVPFGAPPQAQRSP
jgi:hypothetical protein